jgi:hypothetical protein
LGSAARRSLDPQTGFQLLNVTDAKD